VIYHYSFVELQKCAEWKGTSRGGKRKEGGEGVEHDLHFIHETHYFVQSVKKNVLKHSARIELDLVPAYKVHIK
jgi:hypothetical protein